MLYSVELSMVKCVFRLAFPSVLWVDLKFGSSGSLTSWIIIIRRDGAKPGPPLAVALASTVLVAVVGKFHGRPSESRPLCSGERRMSSHVNAGHVRQGRLVYH